MAPKEDQKAKRASVEAAKVAHSGTTAEPTSYIMKTVNFLTRRSDEDASESKTLKEENKKPNPEPEEASTQLHELNKKYQRLKDTARADRREKDELTQEYSKIADQRDLYQQRIFEITEQHQEAQADAHELRKKLQREEADKRKLQDQVAEFKNLISSSSHIDNQVADDVIRAKSDQIFYSIQGFVVKTFRGVTFDFARIPQHTQPFMQSYVPKADTLPKAFWLNIINSLVAQIMMHGFRPGYFFGETGVFPVVAASDLARGFPEPVDSKWLTTTRKLLDENAKEALQVSDSQLAERSYDMLHNTLRSAAAIEWSPGTRERLVQIFHRAQEFYRLVYSQQSGLEIVLPHAMVAGKAQPFIPEQMEMVNSGIEDEAALVGSPIEISVFPAVYKRDNASSSNSGVATVVAKAKVVPRM